MYLIYILWRTLVSKIQSSSTLTSGACKKRMTQIGLPNLALRPFPQTTIVKCAHNHNIHFQKPLHGKGSLYNLFNTSGTCILIYRNTRTSQVTFSYTKIARKKFGKTAWSFLCIITTTKIAMALTKQYTLQIHNVK